MALIDGEAGPQDLLEFQAGAVLTATVSDPDGSVATPNVPDVYRRHHHCHVEMVQVGEQHGAVDA